MAWLQQLSLCASKVSALTVLRPATQQLDVEKHVQAGTSEAALA